MSKIIVTPIGGTTIMWLDFLKDIQKYTGKSPSRSIDTDGRHLTPYGKFIVALEEFRAGKQLKSIPTLINSQQTLHHLFFSFIIIAPSLTVLQIAEIGKLSLISTKVDRKRAIYASATMAQWKEATITALSGPAYSKDIREVFGLILSFFQTIGLKYIFSSYQRKTLNDGTFLLEYKP